MDAERLDIELPDPKDRIFYEVVMEKRKTEKAYLVTGNIRHIRWYPLGMGGRSSVNRWA